MMGLASLLVATAGAWTCAPNGCSGCSYLDGSSKTYRILANDFTTAEIAEIEAGAAAWRAGAGQLNRGADWEFVRGNDVTGWGHSNSRLDVVMEPDQFFDDHDFEDSLASTWITLFPWPTCSRRETDVIFRSSVSWSTSLPNGINGNTPASIGTVAAHEFGHVLGFWHDDSTGPSPLCMHGEYPNGCDVSAQLRITENDYVGLESVKSDSSTGKNLMVSKFERVWGTTVGEIWRVPASGVWEVCAGTTLTGAQRPDPVYVHLTGTTSLDDVDVQWSLSSDTICDDDDDIILGTETRDLGVGVPTEVQLSPWTVPTGTVYGTYTLCVTVDPDDPTDDFAETRENDNKVQADQPFKVLHPLFAQCNGL